MIENMKRINMLLAAILCFTVGCANSDPEPTPTLPTEPVVQEDIGVQVIHAGYYERIESVVEDRVENVKKAVRVIPDRRITEQYDYDGRRKQVHTTTRDGKELVFESEYSYDYADIGSTSKIFSYDDKGKVIFEAENNGDQWNILTSNTKQDPQLDKYGNVTCYTGSDGTLLRKTYNSNGFITEESEEKDGKILQKTTYDYSSNDHLPDSIVKTDINGNITANIYVSRGYLYKNKKISHYFDTKGNAESICKITDSYDDATGLLLSSVIEYDEHTTIKLYEYK